MTDVYKLFEDHIYLPDDFTECNWYESGCDAVYWTEEDNLDDLFNGDGETYSGEILGTPIELDGFVMFLIDNGCGDKYQAIFSLDKKQDEDAYWESLEEEG